jgi:hypothetical protein
MSALSLIKMFVAISYLQQQPLLRQYLYFCTSKASKAAR